MKAQLLRIEKQIGLAKKILTDDHVLNMDIDFSYPFIPPYSRAEDINEIKLIVIGQDPTVRKKESRGKIKSTLNLDKGNSLKSYISLICKKLNIDFEKEVYATNLYKCFFRKPPADDEAVLTRQFKIWTDLLIDELRVFRNPIIITLGEPLIRQLIHTGKREVKYYWDYIGETKSGGKFKFIESTNNYLQNRIYPIAHQTTGTRNKFYKDYLDDYLTFIQKAEKNKSTKA